MKKSVETNNSGTGEPAPGLASTSGRKRSVRAGAADRLALAWEAALALDEGVVGGGGLGLEAPRTRL